MSSRSQTIRIPAHLPPRQRQVLQHLANGETTGSIAHILNISCKTVEFHRLNLMSRTGLFTYQHLTKLAIRLGLTTLDV